MNGPESKAKREPGRPRIPPRLKSLNSDLHAFLDKCVRTHPDAGKRYVLHINLNPSLVNKRADLRFFQTLDGTWRYGLQVFFSLADPSVQRIGDVFRSTVKHNRAYVSSASALSDSVSSSSSKSGKRLSRSGAGSFVASSVAAYQMGLDSGSKTLFLKMSVPVFSHNMPGNKGELTTGMCKIEAFWKTFLTMIFHHVYYAFQQAGQESELSSSLQSDIPPRKKPIVQPDLKKTLFTYPISAEICERIRSMEKFLPFPMSQALIVDILRNWNPSARESDPDNREFVRAKISQIIFDRDPTEADIFSIPSIATSSLSEKGGENETITDFFWLSVTSCFCEGLHDSLPNIRRFLEKEKLDFNEETSTQKTNSSLFCGSPAFPPANTPTISADQSKSTTNTYTKEDGTYSDMDEAASNFDWLPTDEIFFSDASQHGGADTTDFFFKAGSAIELPDTNDTQHWSDFPHSDGHTSVGFHNYPFSPKAHESSGHTSCARYPETHQSLTSNLPFSSASLFTIPHDFPTPSIHNSSDYARFLEELPKERRDMFESIMRDNSKYASASMVGTLTSIIEEQKMTITKLQQDNLAIQSCAQAALAVENRNLTDAVQEGYQKAKRHYAAFPRFLRGIELAVKRIEGNTLALQSLMHGISDLTTHSKSANTDLLRESVVRICTETASVSKELEAFRLATSDFLAAHFENSVPEMLIRPAPQCSALLPLDFSRDQTRLAQLHTRNTNGTHVSSAQNRPSQQHLPCITEIQKLPIPEIRHQRSDISPVATEKEDSQGSSIRTASISITTLSLPTISNLSSSKPPSETRKRKDREIGILLDKKSTIIPEPERGEPPLKKARKPRGSQLRDKSKKSMKQDDIKLISSDRKKLPPDIIDFIRSID